MKTNELTSLIILVLCLADGTRTFADPLGSAFTYQGRLTDSGGPATGLYDFQFVLCDAATNGAALGTNTVAAVPVTNGLYNVALDFGANAFDGNARWLALSVRTNGGISWTALSPRLGLTPTPYAIRATTAGGVSGVIPDSQLSANITRLNGTNVFTGPVTAPSFSGNGSSLSGVAPASGSTNYVAKAGDIMTGPLNLPANGLVAGGSQLVLSGGKVGIGTTSPGDLLHVGSASVRGAVQIQGSTTTFPVLQLNDVRTNGKAWNLYSGSASTGYFSILDAVQNVQRLVIDSNGNVGIGTISPKAKLEAYEDGTGTTTPTLEVHDHTASAAVGKSSLQVVTRDDSANTFVARFQGNDGLTDCLAVKASGNVGIGTTTPQGKLEVSGTYPQLRLSNPGIGSGIEMDFVDVGVLRQRIGGFTDSRYLQFGTGGTDANGTGLAPRMTIDDAGNVGIGTTSPAEKLTVQNGATVVYKDTDTSSSWSDAQFRACGLTDAAKRLAVGFDTSGDFGYIQAWRDNDAVKPLALQSKGGNVGIGTASPTAKLEVAGNLKVSGSGNSISTPVLSITGGSDVAEPFPLATQEIPKGSVVVIDDEHPGQLKLSTEPYDQRVAGIVSGANGINPGITLSQQGALEGGQNVALSGRVYVFADAANAPIKPGDLLTTSPVPGHAMKVTDHAKAQGAILGKAMSRLPEGRGLVLVLVTLQ